MHSEDDFELNVAKMAIAALILLWWVLPFLISELQAAELQAPWPDEPVAAAFELSLDSGWGQ